MSQRLQIWPVSGDNGPASPDLARIWGQWASVSRSGPYLGTMSQRLQIWPVSGDNEPASPDLARIWGQWASVSRSGPYLGTMGQRLQIWPVSGDNEPASPDLACIHGRQPVSWDSGWDPWAYPPSARSSRLSGWRARAWRRSAWAPAGSPRTRRVLTASA